VVFRGLERDSNWNFYGSLKTRLKETESGTRRNGTWLLLRWSDVKETAEFAKGSVRRPSSEVEMMCQRRSG
jgi:hypothetical protein